MRRVAEERRCASSLSDNLEAPGLVRDSCISRVRHINDTSLVHTCTSFFPLRPSLCLLLI